MKIDYAIHSSDSNPYYIEYWPIVAPLWRRWGIEPILVYIDYDYETRIIDETYGTVIRMKPIENIPIYFQCQWIRFWIPSKYPDKISILSDIDMLPISKHYFIDIPAKYNENMYLHLNANKFPEILNVCYHIASGHLFKTVLELDDEWINSCNTVYNSGLGIKNHGGHLEGKINWSTDEAYSTQKIVEYYKKHPELFAFNYREPGRRIDRVLWMYEPRLIQHNNYYYDAHCPRPYSENKQQIDLIIKFINETIQLPLEY
jgi:hypothetical protein